MVVVVVVVLFLVLLLGMGLLGVGVVVGWLGGGLFVGWAVVVVMMVGVGVCLWEGRGLGWACRGWVRLRLHPRLLGWHWVRGIMLGVAMVRARKGAGC